MAESDGKKYPTAFYLTAELRTYLQQNEDKCDWDGIVASMIQFRKDVDEGKAGAKISELPQPARPDRIGDPCWYLRYDIMTGRHTYERGTLRAWATDSEYDGGAVIEAANGRCTVVDVGDVWFCDEKPETPKENDNGN